MERSTLTQDIVPLFNLSIPYLLVKGVTRGQVGVHHKPRIMERLVDLGGDGRRETREGGEGGGRGKRGEGEIWPNSWNFTK